MTRTYAAPCRQCGRAIHVTFDREPPDVCGETCRRERKLMHGRRGVRPPDFRRHWDDERLGPCAPLDGLSDEERQRQRDARIAAAIRDGVDMPSLLERFGGGESTIYTAARRHGLELPGYRALPLGMPA